MGKPTFAAGGHVQTPFGKGVVRDVRNNGRLLVEVGTRSLVLQSSLVSPLEPETRVRALSRRAIDAPEVGNDSAAAATAVECDLHGFTVAEALAHAEAVINDALIGGHASLRLIHGRSGGRIRGALHRYLTKLPSVRAFRVDPQNSGVTIVEF